MQGMHAAREVIEASSPSTATRTVDVIVVARGGGSVEDLLPFSDEGLVRAVHAVTHPARLGDRPRAGLPHPRPGRRRARLDAHRRRQAGGARRRRGGPTGAAGARARADGDPRARRPRARTSSTALLSRPSLADPRSGLDERLVEVDALRERARRSFGHRLDRGEDDLVHQLARIRALSPLATLRRGYAVLSDAEGQALSSVATLEPGQDIHIRVADGRIGATTTSVDRIDLITDTARQRRRAAARTTE